MAVVRVLLDTESGAFQEDKEYDRLKELVLHLARWEMFRLGEKQLEDEAAKLSQLITEVEGG